MKLTTIFRFDIDPTATTFVVPVPVGAQLTDIGHDMMRAGAPAIWFLVDPEEKETEKRAFVRAETGKPMAYDSSQLNYAGRCVALGKSQSEAGAPPTPRTVHYFSAVGDAAAAIIDPAEESGGES